MLIPLAPRLTESEQRQRQPWLVLLLFAFLLVIFAAERLLLVLPSAWALRIGEWAAACRLHAEPDLYRWWQLWTGGLVLHDWWQLCLAIPCWLLWAPFLERHIGTLRLAVAFVIALPLSAVPAIFPETLQAVSFLAGGHGVLLGMMAGTWFRQRADMLVIKPGLGMVQVSRVRLRFIVPCTVLALLELLRVLVMDGMLIWPLPALVLVHSVVALAFGLFLSQVGCERQVDCTAESTR